jgi:putative endonuclease
MTIERRSEEELNQSAAGYHGSNKKMTSDGLTAHEATNLLGRFHADYLNVSSAMKEVPDAVKHVIEKRRAKKELTEQDIRAIIEWTKSFEVKKVPGSVRRG